METLRIRRRRSVGDTRSGRTDIGGTEDTHFVLFESSSLFSLGDRPWASQTSCFEVESKDNRPLGGHTYEDEHISLVILQDGGGDRGLLLEKGNSGGVEELSENEGSISEGYLQLVKRRSGQDLGHEAILPEGCRSGVQYT